MVARQKSELLEIITIRCRTLERTDVLPMVKGEAVETKCRNSWRTRLDDETVIKFADRLAIASFLYFCKSTTLRDICTVP